MSGTSVYMNVESSSCSFPPRTPTDIYGILLLPVYFSRHSNLLFAVPHCTSYHCKYLHITRPCIPGTGTVTRNALSMCLLLETIKVYILKLLQYIKLNIGMKLSWVGALKYFIFTHQIQYIMFTHQIH